MRVTELQAPNKLQLAAERYALIKLGSLNLMLLQDGIRTLESIADLESKEPPANGIGWISFQGSAWPVYCLTEDLGIHDTLPESYRICALLSIENGFVGLVCNEVILMAKNEVRPQSIPVCMVSANSPITALVHYEDSMACLTSPQLLADFLTFQDTGISHLKTSRSHYG
ncbi:MAG TPA: hypothetical protein VES38_08730 [Methylotenera sp.]|nr:hypothetical protein [Methylotenera sp.]